MSRVIRWGDGTRFGDPNAYWGSPSYVLQPGDPGFVAPNLTSLLLTMSDTRKFRFALSTLLHAADSLSDAIGDTDYATAMVARLDDPGETPPYIFRTVFETAIADVRAEVQKQGGKTGDAGDLTSDQKAAFAEVERLAAAARRSARLAFPGDGVKLRSEFQVGIDEPQDLASVLERAGKTLAAARKYAAELKKEGWRAADADALEAALAALGEVAQDQDEALADRAQFTAALTRKANLVFKLCQRIQNAARLEYPSTKPNTEAARLRFLLETFPPRDRNQPDGGTQSARRRHADRPGESCEPAHSGAVRLRLTVRDEESGISARPHKLPQPLAPYPTAMQPATALTSSFSHTRSTLYAMNKIQITIIAALIITSAENHAQSASDRAATAQMHINALTHGINGDKIVAQSLERSIQQTNAQIQQLQKQKAARPKTVSDEMIQMQEAALAKATTQLDAVNTRISEKEKSKLHYEQDLRTAQNTMAREKKKEPGSADVPLDEALKRKKGYQSDK